MCELRAKLFARQLWAMTKNPYPILIYSFHRLCFTVRMGALHFCDAHRHIYATRSLNRIEYCLRSKVRDNAKKNKKKRHASSFVVDSFWWLTTSHISSSSPFVLFILGRLIIFSPIAHHTVVSISVSQWLEAKKQCEISTRDNIPKNTEILKGEIQPSSRATFTSSHPSTTFFRTLALNEMSSFVSITS